MLDLQIVTQIIISICVGMSYLAFNYPNILLELKNFIRFYSILAGFIYVNHLAKTNKEFGISTFFDFYKSPALKDIIISQVIITVALNAIATLLIITNHQFIAFFVQLIIYLLT